MSEQEASVFASATLNRAIQPVRADLVVYPMYTLDEMTYHLAWCLLVSHTPENGGPWQIVVDALTGDILLKFEDFNRASSMTGTVSGDVYAEHPGQTQASQSFEHNMIQVEQNDQQVGEDETDSSGNYEVDTTGLSGDVDVKASLTGPYVEVLNDQASESTHSGSVAYNGVHDWNWDDDDSSEQNEESNVFYHLNLVHDWYSFRSPPFDIDETLNYQLDAIVNNDGWNCSAIESLIGGRITFGDGGGYDPPSLYTDFIYHEYTHAVIDKIHGCSPNIAKAAHEAFAMYFGATISGNSCLSENACGYTPCIYNIESNGLKWPDDCDNSSCYEAAQIASGALWDLRNTIGAPDTDALAMNTIRSKVEVYSCPPACVIGTPPVSYCLITCGLSDQCVCEGEGFTPLLASLLIEDDTNADLSDGTPNGRDICDVCAIEHGIRSEFCPYNYDKVVTIENSSGYTVGFFDSGGNLVLEGVLTEDTTPTPDGGTDEFIVRDSSDNVLAVVDVGGDMAIKGDLYENEDSLTPSGSDDLIVRDSEGTAVSYIEQDGDLYLVGHCYQEVDIP